MNTSTEKVYGGYTQQELDDAFALVKNPDDWKAPIATGIDANHDFRIIEAAVIYFTGTVPMIYGNPRHPRTTFIRADGYRMGPCGDH